MRVLRGLVGFSPLRCSGCRGRSTLTLVMGPSGPYGKIGFVPTVLVSLASGAGVVRLNDGSIVISHDSSGGESGTFLNDEDRYRPAKTWLDEEHCVIGGLLPPGAVSAEVADDRGTRVVATVALGAYVAVLDQPNDGHHPVVCCRDRTGHAVRRPWAGDYPNVRVTDAEEPCPACGAIDYDEYSPYEEWRGGRGRGDGTIVPNPVVSCRVCGHDEAERTSRRVSGRVLDGEDFHARRDQRLLTAAMFRGGGRDISMRSATLSSPADMAYGARRL